MADYGLIGKCIDPYRRKMNLSNRYERLSAGILTSAVEEVPCVFDRRRYGFPYKANMITGMLIDICVC